MLEEDAMHLQTEADVSAHVLDTSGKKTQLRGWLDTGAVLSVEPIETWRKWNSTKTTWLTQEYGCQQQTRGRFVSR